MAAGSVTAAAYQRDSHKVLGPLMRFANNPPSNSTEEKTWIPK
jgi:hypothetical protein